MCVGEEGGRVVNDLANVEASTSVCGGVGDVNTSAEWAGQASIRDTPGVRADRVGKSKTGRTSTTLDSLVNVGGSESRGHVHAGDTAQGDVLETILVKSKCVWMGKLT